MMSLDAAEPTWCGLSEKQFQARITGAVQALAAKRDTERQMAAKENRYPRDTPDSQRLTVLVPPWGWMLYQVHITGDFDWVGVGIARPDRPTTSGLELLSTAHRDNDTLIISGGGIGAGAIFTIGSIALHLPVWAGGPATVIGAGGGVYAGLRSLRFLARRKNADSRLILQSDMTTEQEPIVRAIGRQAQVRAALAIFDADMKRHARRTHLQPQPLFRDSQARSDVESRLYQAAWDIASRQSARTDDDIQDEIEEMTAAIDAAIETAWGAMNSLTVNEAPVEDNALDTVMDEPAFRRDTVADLRELREAITADTEATKAATREVQRMNGYHPEQLNEPPDPGTLHEGHSAFDK